MEAIAHHVKGLRCGRAVEKLSIMLGKLQRMVIDFLNLLQAAHLSFLPEGVLDALGEPTQRGSRRLAGVDLQKPRMRAIAEAVLALAPQPEGFTVTELAGKVRERQPAKASPYATRLAAYDLIKLRGRFCSEKVIKPVLAGAGKPRAGRPPTKLHPLDQHYVNLQREMYRTFKTLALAA